MKKFLLLIPVILVSLAINAATPELTKSTPLKLMASTATLSTNGSIVNDSITWPESTIHQGYAKWRVNLINSAAYKVSLDMRSNNAFFFRISVVNPATGDTLVQTRSQKESDKVYSDLDCGNLVMCNLSAGEYDIVVTDTIKWSHGKVASMTLTYLGGDEITTTAYDTLPGSLAFVSGGMIKLAGGDIKSSGAKDQSSEYPAWFINATKSGRYIVSFIGDAGGSGHRYSVGLHSKISSASSDVVSEPANSWTNGTISFADTLDIPAKGNYYIKLTNACEYSSKSISGLILRYIGGDSIAIPNTLITADALISNDWYKEKDSVCHAESNALTGWAKWYTECISSGNFNIKVNISSDNGHLVRVEIFENESSSATYTLDESSSTKWSTGKLTVDLGDVVLSKRSYVIKASNTLANSHVKIVSIEITYGGGATITIPGTLSGTDVLLSATKMTHLENGDIKYNDNGSPTDEYAYWNIHAKAGTYNVILYIPEESTSGHVFQVELHSDLLTAAIDDAYETSESYGKGYITLSQTITVPSENDYIIKLINDRAYSKSTLRSIIIAPTVTISETATNLDALTDDDYVNAQLTRTVKGGMYNPLCLPFAVSASEFSRVFPGAELKTLTESSITDDILNLEFDDATSMTAGKPYLIKPASDVANPKFIGVTIDKTLNPTYTTKANFVGNTVVESLTASENLLYLGANDKLYWLGADYNMPGMRGWFVVTTPKSAIRGARIVDQNRVPTGIELVQPENDSRAAQKVIENGQVIIIRDNIRYNVQGQRIQ